MSAAADALERAFDAAMPPPRLARLVIAALAVLVLGIGGLLAWASITPIERAVIGQGQIAAEGRRKTVMLLEPGLLRRLLVREGERVEAGQPLFQLDTTQADAAAAQARAMFLGQSMRAARLIAEQQDSREMEVPPAVGAASREDPAIAAIVAAESRLFAARWEAYDGALGAPVHEGGGPVAHRLPALEPWLDHAVDLGCSGLLLGPIFTSVSHGYDTLDHFSIDPRLGDDADFDRLVAACRERGMALMLDGVFNHVSTQHGLVDS